MTIVDHSWHGIVDSFFGSGRQSSTTKAMSYSKQAHTITTDAEERTSTLQRLEVLNVPSSVVLLFLLSVYTACKSEDHSYPHDQP